MLDAVGPLEGELVIVLAHGGFACGVLRGDRLPGPLCGTALRSPADLGVLHLESRQDHTAPQVNVSPVIRATWSL